MPSKVISLFFMPDEIMLIIGHNSDIWYENQIGGIICAQERYEGVLAPCSMSNESARRLMELAYPTSAEGLSNEIANAIDEILAAEEIGKYVKVNRDRLHESFESWIHVTIETPLSADDEGAPPFRGSWRGFGIVPGVLTWPNSD